MALLILKNTIQQSKESVINEQEEIHSCLNINAKKGHGILQKGREFFLFAVKAAPRRSALTLN